MKTSEKTMTIHISKVRPDQWLHAEDVLAVEEPLEIHIRYHGHQGIESRSIAVTMRTPGNDLELAVGFLFTEGIITSASQIETHRADPASNRIVIVLKAGETPSLQKAERNFYTTSSCGVCGKSSIDAIKAVSSFNIADRRFDITVDTIRRLESELVAQQAIFSKTGGLHASALFDAHGRFISLYEDVGRHNALDKAIGNACLRNNLPLTNTILLLSGRASFELIQKASMAGIGIVAAFGAPSSLAVNLAKEIGITLIGFLRGDQFNIYCGAERIHDGMLSKTI